MGIGPASQPSCHAQKQNAPPFPISAQTRKWFVLNQVTSPMEPAAESVLPALSALPCLPCLRVGLAMLLCFQPSLFSCLMDLKPPCKCSQNSLFLFPVLFAQIPQSMCFPLQSCHPMSLLGPKWGEKGGEGEGEKKEKGSKEGEAGMR